MKEITTPKNSKSDTQFRPCMPVSRYSTLL